MPTISSCLLALKSQHSMPTEGQLKISLPGPLIICAAELQTRSSGGNLVVQEHIWGLMGVS